MEVKQLGLKPVPLGAQGCLLCIPYDPVSLKLTIRGNSLLVLSTSLDWPANLSAADSVTRPLVVSGCLCSWGRIGVTNRGASTSSPR